MNTVSEIAKKLRISGRMVYKLVETGQLRSYKIGTAIRISDEQLEIYLRGCEGKTVSHSRGDSLRRLRV